ncbi:MAG TPA: ABC transporter permease [Baekduia sp.]|nr:ABC transporter permease [Baekduia sp.]
MTPASSLVPAQDAEAQADDVPTRRRRTGRPVAYYLEAYALVILLVVAAIFFTVYPDTADTFPTAANLRILVASQAVIAIVSIGVLLPLVTQEFDLSVGALAALSAVVVAELLSKSTPLILSIVIGIGVGGAIGTVNAMIITRLRVNAVVATLGMGTIVGGMITQITGGLATASDIPDVLTSFGTGNVLGIPGIFLAMLVVAGVAFFVLEHTPFGRYLYAYGSNPHAALLVGVRTDFIRAMAFIVGGSLAGLAGVFYVARAGGADPKLSQTFLLPSFAAAFLSAASIRPGRFNVWGTLVAIYFLAVLNNGLNLAGAAPYVSDYINGGALIVGLSLAAFLSRRRARA